MGITSDLPTRFFKVILPSSTALHKLRMPDKFAAKYGHKLCNIVKIEDSIGGVWCVRLERAEKKIWLHHGWEKFTKHHSIGFGYFLVFKYTGNSDFIVRIFDLTATEIDYPLDSSGCADGTSCNIQDSIPVKDEPSDDESSDEDPVKVITSSSSTELDENQSSFRIRSRLAMKLNHVAGKNLLKNPSFRAILKEYNLKSVLDMPVAFSRHIPSSTTHVKLYDSNGKKWLVKVNHRCGRLHGLRGGWSIFAKEKNLKAGDTCVFELIDCNEPTVKVSILSNANGNRNK